MVSDEPWWRQIVEAIEHASFLVFVLTPAALRSSVVRKEWLYARKRGVRVYPVLGPAGLDFAALPRWLRKKHLYNLDKEWHKFVEHIKAPPRPGRVPFMAPGLPEGFVERPDEFEQLLGHLLDGDRVNPVAITTALHGAGGFGKTTLAAALCHHPDVQLAFDDGILWATLGERPNLLERLTQLYAALSGERPGFVTVEDAASQLAQQLEDRDCLLVIDDVWDAAHLRPFQGNGKSCARLITTRNFALAAEAARVGCWQVAALLGPGAAAGSLEGHGSPG